MYTIWQPWIFIEANVQKMDPELTDRLNRILFAEVCNDDERC
jgi:hypothetical protein